MRAAGESAKIVPRRQRWFHRLGWLSGLLLLAVVLAVSLRFAEVERFAQMLGRAEPAWLLVALALQAGTYLCAARVLQQSLARSGVRQPLSRLVPLSLAKLFTDQAVPTVGLSGTLLTVQSLARHGVPRGVSTGAMLIGLVAHYLAYAAIVALALGCLWWRGELNPALLTLTSIFGVLVAAAPLGLFWLRDRAARRLPAWTGRLPAIREAIAALGEVPSERLRQPRLIAHLVFWQTAVFLLDAATLGVMLRAVAVSAPPDVVLSAFVIASVVATLSWVPGGLGTFDATCVAMLHWHGVAIEAALAATLLLRGFAFWLPMLPGMWLAHAALGGAAAAGGQAPAGRSPPAVGGEAAAGAPPTHRTSNAQGHLAAGRRG